MHSRSVFPRQSRRGRTWGFLLYLLITIPALILFFRQY
jgi:hypothetical protein